MTADVSLQALWFNKGIASYFFREQAYNTLEDLVERVGGRESSAAFDDLEARIDEVYNSLDDFEEDCYSYGTEDLLEALGYETEREY